MKSQVLVQRYQTLPYLDAWQQQKTITLSRDQNTIDQIWLLEHDSVYTLGQAAKESHLLNPGVIPVIKTDRGGQVTYHGPGQLIVYFLINLPRKKLDIRQFTNILEQSVIELLANYEIEAHTKPNAPGIYVDGAKIGSIGIRVRKGCTYHGLSLNVGMDLKPFKYINPCGYPGLEMTQISDLGGPNCTKKIGQELLAILTKNLDYTQVSYG